MSMDSKGLNIEDIQRMEKQITNSSLDRYGWANSYDPSLDDKSETGRYSQKTKDMSKRIQKFNKVSCKLTGALKLNLGIRSLETLSRKGENTSPSEFINKLSENSKQKDLRVYGQSIFKILIFRTNKY